jgi:hypothetical protein
MPNSLRTLVLLFAAAAIFSLASCGGSKINKANFDKIKPGMTESEVEGILGKGEEKASVGGGMPGPGVQVPAAPNIGGMLPMALPNLKTKVWQDGSKTITIIFVDGKVTIPAQSGL